MLQLLITLAIVLLSVGGGWFYIKHQRRVQTERQQLRWKISEGDVADDAALPVKKSWLSVFRRGPSLPDHLQPLLAALPQRTDELLRAYKPYKDNAPLMYQAAYVYAGYLRTPPALTAADVKDSASFAKWWGKAVDAAFKHRRAGRELRLRYDRYMQTSGILYLHDQLKESLQPVLTHGTHRLPPSQQLVAELAERVLTSVKLMNSNPDLAAHPRPLQREPQTPHADAEYWCRQLFGKLQKLVGLTSGMLACLQTAEKEAAALAKLEKTGDIADPVRPVEADVKVWLAAADQWALRKRDARKALRERLLKLDGAAQALESNTEVDKIISACREWEHESPCREKFEDPNTPDELRGPEFFISDEALAMFQIAETVRCFYLDQCQAARKFQRVQLESHGANEFLEHDESHEKTRSALMAAVRKLGFAVGQSVAAKAKFEAAEAAGKSKPTWGALSLEAPNADAFIAAHKRWMDAGKRSDRLFEDQRASLEDLRKQKNERAAQVQSAAIAVCTLLDKHKLRDGTTPRSAQLQLAVEAAVMLYDRYFVEPRVHYSSYDDGSMSSSYSSSCGGSY